MRLLADENLPSAIVRGLVAHQPRVDFVRVQDVGLTSVDDPTILEWAAREGRLVVTHDARTMIKFALERSVSGKRMPGIIVLPHPMAAGEAIEQLLLLAECSLEGEWEGRVIYLPL